MSPRGGIRSDDTKIVGSVSINHTAPQWKLVWKPMALKDTLRPNLSQMSGHILQLLKKICICLLLPEKVKGCSVWEIWPKHGFGEWKPETSGPVFWPELSHACVAPIARTSEDFAPGTAQSNNFVISNFSQFYLVFLCWRNCDVTKSHLGIFISKASFLRWLSFSFSPRFKNLFSPHTVRAALLVQNWFNSDARKKIVCVERPFERKRCWAESLSFRTPAGPGEAFMQLSILKFELECSFWTNKNGNLIHTGSSCIHMKFTSEIRIKEWAAKHRNHLIPSSFLLTFVYNSSTCLFDNDFKISAIIFSLSDFDSLILVGGIYDRNMAFQTQIFEGSILIGGWIKALMLLPASWDFLDIETCNSNWWSHSWRDLYRVVPGKRGQNKKGNGVTKKDCFVLFRAEKVQNVLMRPLPGGCER